MVRIFIYNIFIVFVLGIHSSYAQSSNSKINWGPQYRIKGGNNGTYKFLGLQGDHYFFVERPGQSNTLLTFDAQHNLLSSNNFNQIEANQRLNIHGAIDTRSGTFIYSHQYNRKYNEWILYAGPLSVNNDLRLREVYFQEYKIDKGRLESKFRDFQFDYGPVENSLIMSKDSSKVAFVNVIPTTNYREEEVIAVAVFDDKMNLLWKDAFFYKYGKDRVFFDQTVVSDNGEIFMVLSTDRQREKTRGITTRGEKNLPNIEFVLLNINQEGILEHKLKLERKIAPTDVALFFPDAGSNRFLIAGFYGDMEHANRIKGMFFQYSDSEFNNQALRTYEFENSFLRDLVREKDIRKGKGLSDNFAITDIINYEDGKIGFVAEERYERVNWNNNNPFIGPGIYRNNGFNDRWIEFFTDDMIIAKFNPDGTLLNLQKIIKRSRSINPSMTSYALAHSNNFTYLIYNDEKTGKERKEIKKKGRLFTDIAIIDDRGNIVFQETLFTNREIPYIFDTNLSQFNDELLLIGTQQGSGFQMGTLLFNHD